MIDTHDNQLLASGLPIFFAVADFDECDLSSPSNRHGQTVRTWARSLSGMQKEALVLSLRSGKAWRLASDEGPYLNGHDTAPCPLSFLTTGMIASTMDEILAVSRQRGITIREIVLVQDNFYTMEGSALKGTMVGGALPIELEVQIDCDADDDALDEMLLHAVKASPLIGFITQIHRSLFTLTVNEDEIGVEGVGSIDAPAERDSRDWSAAVLPRDENKNCDDLVTRLETVEPVKNAPGGAGSSLKATQSRQLHIRGTCRSRPDGVKEIRQELFSSLGSTFMFLSDESEEFGGRGVAPDAMSYAAAGIAFCFMTQLGRYANITKKRLDGYRVIQDSHFSVGSASGGNGAAGSADAIETHVYLDTPEGSDFARTALDMGEQTCFLHALCRSELETKIVTTRVGRTPD